MDRETGFKLLAIACIVVTVFLGGMLFQQHRAGQENKAAEESAAPPAPPAPPPPPPPVVTREEYDALRYDMRYEEVLDIIGEEEVERKSVYDKGVEGYTRPILTVWHFWRNPDGSEVSLAFVREKLVEKQEKKLPQAAE